MQAAFKPRMPPGWLVGRRWLRVPAYVAVPGRAVLGAWDPGSGPELFPQADLGQFVIRFRAPPGSDFEITRQVWAKGKPGDSEEAGAENVEIGMGFAGQISPLFSINNLILFIAARTTARCVSPYARAQAFACNPRAAAGVLPCKVKPWLADLLQKQGLTQESAQAQAEQAFFGFEPGDMVSEVMSFGSRNFIENVVASPNLADTSAKPSGSWRR